MNHDDALAKINKKIKTVNSIYLRVFLYLRLRLLPLDIYYDKIYKKGKITEIGCGHGLISYYLSLRNPHLEICGIDPDKNRIKFAKNFFNSKNLTFIDDYINSSNSKNSNCFIIIGVFCLLEIDQINHILNILKSNLNKSGVIYFSDIKKTSLFNVIYLFHLIRENLFHYISFTFGTKIIPRLPKKWLEIFSFNGFSIEEFVDAPVPLHSTIDIIFTHDKNK